MMSLNLRKCFLQPKAHLAKAVMVIALIVLLDQLSKFYVREILLAGQSMLKVTGFFNVVQVWNTGISFGLLNNGATQHLLLNLAIMLLTLALIIWLIYAHDHKPTALALTAMIGGSLGNIIDRVKLGAVYDFFDFYIGNWHWPAFNIADSFITIGAIYLFMNSFLTAKK